MKREGSFTRRSWPLALVVAGLVFLTRIAAAPPSDPSEILRSAIRESTRVELVLIELYVTDTEGRPIRDLTPDDLILTVDSHRKPIQSLEYREAGSGTSALADSELRPSSSARLPRRFVLFFEDDTSSPQGLTAARRSARRFLSEGLLKDDEVAVASYDRRLRVLQELTTDREALARTIEATLSDPRRFSDYASDQVSSERSFAELMGSMRAGLSAEANGARLRTLILNYASEATPRSRDVLVALRTLIDSLSLYPGYKSIVFMGDGVAENPGVDFLQRFGEQIPPGMISDLRRYDLSADITKIAHEASAAGVTLHSLQTSGLSSVTGVEMRDAGRRSNALETIALNTGGIKSTSNDLLKGLREAEQASRAYYLVGYAPEGPPDGQYHTVQIRLKGRSAALRWRRGFTRLLPDQMRQRSIEAAYALPELFTGMGIQLSGIAGPVEGGARVYDFVMHLPPGRVLFVPQPEGSTARLEAGFVLIDDARRETARTARGVLLTVPGGRTPGALGVNLFSRIKLSGAGQTVTAVVLDTTAGTVGAARLAIPPSDASTTSHAAGLSIYSLREESLWVEIPESRVAPASTATQTEYQIGPALKSTFTIGEPLACGFRLLGRDAPGDIRLLVRDGHREARATVWTTRELGAVNADLPVKGLPAGDYRVVVQARDAQGLESEIGSTPLRLRAEEGPPPGL